MKDDKELLADLLPSEWPEGGITQQEVLRDLIEIRTSIREYRRPLVSALRNNTEYLLMIEELIEKLRAEKDDRS